MCIMSGGEGKILVYKAGNGAAEVARERFSFPNLGTRSLMSLSCMCWRAIRPLENGGHISGFVHLRRKNFQFWEECPLWPLATAALVQFPMLPCAMVCGHQVGHRRFPGYSGSVNNKFTDTPRSVQTRGKLLLLAFQTISLHK